MLFGTQVLERVIVSVNGSILTQSELERRQVSVVGQTTGTIPTIEAVRASAELRAIRDAATPRILADAIDELLVLDRARDLGITVSDAQVDAVLDAFRRDNAIVTADDFARLLLQARLTEPELRRSLARQIVIRGVQEADVFNRLDVSDEAARALFEREKAAFATAETVVFRELSVSLPGGAYSVAYTNGLIRFVRARDRLAAGEAFDAVARALSDAPSKAAGGLVGPVHSADLPPQIGDALRRLRPGEISPPIRVPEGYVIVALERATPAASREFAQVRDAIVERLLQEQRASALEAYMRRLRGAALIHWKDEALRRSFESHAAAARGSRH
jgi:peptidyl-prolyl cis-trans isomerase SurA